MAILFPLLLCANAAHAQCMYEIVATITGPECAPGDFASFGPSAIDADGNVAGAVTCSIGLTAAVWAGGVTAVPLPGSGETITLDMADPDHVVGITRSSGGAANVAAQWVDGQIQLLEELPSQFFANAYGINRDYRVVGQAVDAALGISYAVAWEDGLMEILDPQPGPDAVANDINDHGQITGYIIAPSAGSAFIWHDGQFELLGAIPGGVSSVGIAINNHGHVAGRGWIPDPISGFGLWHAMIWQNSITADIGVLPGMNTSHARDLNDVDQIVGESSVDGNSNRAFLWQKGAMYQLQDLVVDDLGGSDLILAAGINNDGWIVAFNGQFSYLLKPVGSAPGDVDNDCVVGIDDFLLVLTEWGKPNSPADTNDDGLVGILDFLRVLSDWG